MKANLDYDFDEVISFCTSTAGDGINQLINDLNSLCNELDECQDKFHCKGGDSANAVIKIYKGFSATIGGSNGLYSLNNSTGLGKLATYAAVLVNTCYSEAVLDKKRAEDVSGMNW